MKLRTRYTQRYPTAPGLVLDTPLFEGSGLIAHDMSGKGNNGTVTGATWGTNEKGVCLSFDGSGDRVDCGNDSSLALSTQGVMEIESYRTAYKAYGGLIVKRDAGGNLTYGIVEGGSANEIRPIIKQADTTEKYVDYNIALSTVFYIAAVWDGSNLISYVDGVSVTSIGCTSIATDAGVALYIGTHNAGSYIDYTGTLAKARIYNQTLTPDQSKRRYEQPDKDYCRGS